MRAVEFLGRAYGIPGSYATFRTQPATGGISPDLNTLVLIGASDNGWFFGDPTIADGQRIQEFGSFPEAAAVLGSGDLLDAIKAAFAPSRDARFASGPALIRALNVSRNTAAGAAALDAGGVSVTLRAIVPGPRGNELRFRVSDSGDRIDAGDASGLQSQNGLTAADLRIEYSGSATAVALAFDGAALRIDVTGATDGSASLLLPADEFRTLGDLADRINAAAHVTATVESNPDGLVVDLDHVAGVDLLAGPVELKSALARQARALRALANVELVAPPVRRPLADTAGFMYLTGGAKAAPLPADWLAAIQALDRAPGFYVNVLTHAPGVVAALLDEVTRGNGPAGQRERFAGAGARQTDAIETRIAEAKALNSEFLCYGVSPVTLFRADGVTEKTFDGWMTAVLHNACKAAANVRESAFYKDLNVRGCPEKLSRVTMEKAILAGGLVLRQKPTGAFCLAADRTTYQRNDLIRGKAQLICTALALVKDLRESLEERFLGEVPTDPDARGGSLTDADIRTFVDLKFDLDYVQNFGWLTRNIYTGEDAYRRDYVIQRDGNVIYFTFPDGKVVTSLDFIFSLLALDVVRGVSRA